MAYEHKDIGYISMLIISGKVSKARIHMLSEHEIKGLV